MKEESLLKSKTVNEVYTARDQEFSLYSTARLYLFEAQGTLHEYIDQLVVFCFIDQAHSWMASDERYLTLHDINHIVT